MAQITADTERDSVETLQRLISFLQEELRHRGAAPVNPVPVQSMPVDSGNPFGSMFSDSEPSSGQQETVPSSSATASDMFSMFSHESSEPSPSEPSPTVNPLDTQMDTTAPGPSATQLLEEDDVKDVTESLAEEVWKTGSTRNTKTPRIEPYN